MKELHSQHFQEVQQQLGVILHKLFNSDSEKSSAHTPRSNKDILSNNILTLTFPKSIKLEFPKFRGEEPTAWVYKANQYFRYYKTPDPEKLLMAAFHMEGEALIWFQDGEEAGLFGNWLAFVQALQVRFGSTVYDDLMEALTRLRKTTSVITYKIQFEALSNRIKGLSESHKLSCFLSGLKDEVRLAIRMFAPQSLNAAFGLAKIQEEYLLSSKKGSKSFQEVIKPSILGAPPKLDWKGEQKMRLPLRRLTPA